MAHTNEVGQRPIDAMGFGIIPKMLMIDKEITSEAKAVYAYIASYAGAGAVAFPSVTLICEHLGMSEARFRKHRKLLEDKGYLKIIRERNSNRMGKNKYYLTPICNSKQQKQEKPVIIENSLPVDFVGIENVSVENVSVENVSVENVSIENLPVENVSVENVRHNNNSIKNNNYKNNNYKNNNDFGVSSSQLQKQKNITAEDDDPLKPLSPSVAETMKKFIEYRKAIKKPMTPYAVKLMVKKLLGNEFKNDCERIKQLETSIINNWQDVFPVNRPQETETNNKQDKAQPSEKNWGWIPQKFVLRAEQLVTSRRWVGALAYLDGVMRSTPPDEREQALRKCDIDFRSYEERGA